MKEIIQALGTGIGCGLIFSALRLPIPAPSVIPGIAGIVGIFIGFHLWKLIVKQ